MSADTSTEVAEGTPGPAPAPETELDLDGARPPGRIRRPFAAGLVAAALLAGLAGAGVRGVLLGPAVSSSDAVSARLTLRDVQLRPEPVAILRLTVTGVSASRLTALSIGGGGLQATLSESRALESTGDRLETEVTAQLRCRLRTAQTPVAAVVQVDAAGTAVGVGDVVTVGRVAQPGGVCRFADERLPDGWQDPVDVVSASVPRNDQLELRVRGLAVSDRVIGGVSGAELFQVERADRRADGSTVILLAAAPPRICGQQPPSELPAGVGLRVLGPSQSSRLRYAAAGPIVASWVAWQRARPCDAEGQDTP